MADVELIFDTMRDKPRLVKLVDLPDDALRALASAGNLDAASILVTRGL